MQSKLLQARGIIQKASQYLEVTTKFTPIEQQGSELTKRWESIWSHVKRWLKQRNQTDSVLTLDL